MKLDPRVIDGLRRRLTPRAYIRVTPLRYAATPLGMGFGETRFASPSRKFKVLYLGQTLTTAIAETIVRDRFVGRRRHRITDEEVLSWGVTEIGVSEPLNLLDLTGTGLVRLGVPTNAVKGKAQGPGQRLSEALHGADPNIDGIFYPSRLTNQLCMAIYERATRKLRPGRVHPLSHQPGLESAFRELNVEVITS